MRTFIVRRNCEYSVAIEAVSDAEAIRMAPADLSDWDSAWSPTEAEEE